MMEYMDVRGVRGGSTNLVVCQGCHCNDVRLSISVDGKGGFDHLIMITCVCVCYVMLCYAAMLCYAMVWYGMVLYVCMHVCMYDVCSVV